MGVYRPKKSKYWWIDFYHKGKRYRESSGSTRKRDAEQLYARRKYEISQEKFNPSSANKDLTFAEFQPRYMDWATDHKKASTIERNYQFLDHLKPYVFDKQLSKIDLMIAEGYRKDRKKQGASNATINRERSFLKAVLNKAVRWGVIEKNQLQYMEQLPEPHLFNRYLTIHETLKLIDVSEPHLKPMIVTSIFTGFRWGDVQTLKWDEVDMTNDIINKKLSEGSDGNQTKPKGIYPLPDQAKQEIKKIARNGSSYIFTNPKTGRPWQNLRKAFARAKAKAGITRPFRVHDLRHSFASNLVMDGYDLKTVQELLGHKNISTTTRYAHLSMSHKRKAVNGLFQKERDCQ